jgi:hypothetical protein
LVQADATKPRASTTPMSIRCGLDRFVVAFPHELTAFSQSRSPVAAKGSYPRTWGQGLRGRVPIEVAHAAIATAVLVVPQPQRSTLA